MHKVESKYKDPDRYIQVLKGQVKLAEGQSDYETRRLGDRLFRYGRETTHEFTVNDRSLGCCRTQDHLIIIGRICHTEENCESSGVTIDNIQVRRRRDHN